MSYEQLQLKDAHEKKLLFTPYLPSCEPDMVPGPEQLVQEKLGNLLH